MNRFIAAAGILATMVALAQAAFTSPTPEQIKDAAKNPGKVAVLLAGADEAQVAAVVADVLAAVKDLGMSEKDLKARVEAILTQAMAGRSADSKKKILDLLAGKLGANPGLAGIAAIVKNFGAPPAPPAGSRGAGGPPPVVPRYAGQ